MQDKDKKRRDEYFGCSGQMAVAIYANQSTTDCWGKDGCGCLRKQQQKSLKTRPPALEKGLWWWITGGCLPVAVGVALLMGCSGGRTLWTIVHVTSY